MTSVLDGWLTCPVCGLDLTQRSRSMDCAAGHSFDIARQGYVNLLGRAAPKNADTPAMLEARARFLGTGHYAPIADAVADAVRGRSRVVEVGAGTGHYLAHTLEGSPDAAGMATDVSVAAAKRAARAHPRAGSIVADTWAGLPLRGACADALLCIFAPRNAAEFERILRPGGTLVVAVPTQNHLRELRQSHGLLGIGEDKVESVLAAFPDWDSRIRTEEYVIALDAAQVVDLIAMGPNAFHGAPTATDGTEATVSVSVLTLTRPAR